MELEKALLQNIQSEHVEKIHLFVDDDLSRETLNGERFNSDKINIIGIRKQPIYSDLFTYANTLVDKLCMITNSDIWVHSVEDARLLDNMPKNHVYSLTRHEYNMSSPLIDDYRGSHDVFIFHAPINQDMIKHIQHPQNEWGSENVMLYELLRHGYTVLNPCRQLKIVHEHASNERNSDRVRLNRGGYDVDGIYKIRSAKVPPSRIEL
jgi:hypothetical protein